MSTLSGGLALELDVIVASQAGDLPTEPDLHRWVVAALEGLRSEAELCIRIVDREEGRALNRDYRGRDYATNVLSFPAELPAGVEIPVLGDLAICADVVRSEANDQDKALQAHWAHMTIHGVLHLLDYDHQQDDEAERMEARERYVLADLGYPDPYAAEAG
jgi:probable rRNA maturation factor